MSPLLLKQGNVSPFVVWGTERERILTIVNSPILLPLQPELYGVRTVLVLCRCTVQGWVEQDWRRVLPLFLPRRDKTPLNDGRSCLFNALVLLPLFGDLRRDIIELEGEKSTESDPWVNLGPLFSLVYFLPLRRVKPFSFPLGTRRKEKVMRAAKDNFPPPRA